jgi:predicted dehydrogenase
MIAEQHLAGWARIPEVQIVALADSRPAAAEARRAAHAPEARVYPDVASLLAAERPDFLDILTPPAVHAEHCRLALAAGVHVICQKPLCPELADARRLVEDMRASPRLFAVHENHRYRPWFAEVRRRFAEGFFGRPCYLRIEQLDPYPPREPFKSGGERAVMLEYGTHLVDMVRALLGEPLRVYGRLHRPNPDVRGDSLAHVLLEYPGATAAVEIAWKAHGLQQGGFLFVGERGEAMYEGRLTRGEQARFRLARGNEIVLDERRSPTADYGESFYLLQREVTDALLAGHAPTQTGDENLRTLAATFAAYQSAVEGRPIALAEVPG